MPLPEFDASDCQVVVHGWPRGHVDARLLRWLQAVHGVRWDSIAVTCQRGVVPAYNKGVAHALASGKTHLLFADNDLIPVGGTPQRPGTDELMGALPADIACCMYEVSHPAAWIREGSFHTGIWRTTRQALLQIGPPWFLEGFSADGSEQTGCACMHLAEKARGAGLAIMRAGWAEHLARPA